MADEFQTLDVPKKQVLAVFFDDEGQFYLHPRELLLHSSEARRRVLATPDYKVQTADLADHRIVPLQRDAVFFPEDSRGYIYGFDTMIAPRLVLRSCGGRHAR